MKKILKITLTIIGTIVICLIIDLISIYTRNKPVFAIKEENYYKGLFYDTYICAEYSVPQIKLKGTKYICSENIEISKQYAYTIETIETKQCNNEKDLYISRENQNIYIYCLDSIKINANNKLIELKDYYNENNKVIEEIINTLDLVNNYKDGSSTLYQDSNSDFTNNGLSIIKCNTILGNQDIYIGPKTIEYENDFCEYDENMREF